MEALEDVTELLDSDYSNTLIESDTDDSFGIMDELLEGMSEDDYVIAILLDRSSEDIEERVQTDDLYTIDYSDNPGDLTGIGMEFSDVFKDIKERKGAAESINDDDVYLFFDNTSMILNYRDEKTRYRFLHVLTGQLKTSGARGYFNHLIDVEEEGQTNAILSLFDAAVSYSDGEGYTVRS